MQMNSTSTNERRMRILRVILVIIISVLLLVCLESWRVYDYDIWVHLKYGQHFMQNHTWSIDHSAYSWTPATRPWTYVTWIGSGVIFLIYKYLSLNAVMSLPFVNLILILTLYVLFLRSINSTYSFMTMALFFTAAVFFYMPVVKPAIFSSLLFAACLAVYYSSRHNNSRTYWAYPFVFLVWVNTHGAFIFGLFSICLILATEIMISVLNKTLQARKAYLQGLGAALLLSFLIVGINPHGFGYFTGIARDIMHVNSLDPAGHISEYANLWGKLYALQETGALGISWASIFMLATYTLLTLLNKKKGIPPDIISAILLLAFFLMGMLYYRLFAFYCLVWLFSITCLVVNKQLTFSSRKFALVSFAIMSYFIANQLNMYLATGLIIHPFKHDIESFYPINATIFLKDHSLPRQLLNDYSTGGYLLWTLYPDYKVFLDPRQWPYRKEILDDFFALGGADSPTQMNSILAKYPEVQTIFLHMRFMTPITVLCQMDSWKLVYFDSIAAIFVRASSSKSSLRPDFDAARFGNIESPRYFMQLFSFYLSLNDYKNARVIRNLYDSNVRSGYLFRPGDLRFMDANLEHNKP
jgi:hypothetical protein